MRVHIALYFWYAITMADNNPWKNLPLLLFKKKKERKRKEKKRKEKKTDQRKPRPCWVDVIAKMTVGCSRGSDVRCFGLERGGEVLYLTKVL